MPVKRENVNTNKSYSLPNKEVLGETNLRHHVFASSEDGDSFLFFIVVVISPHLFRLFTL